MICLSVYCHCMDEQTQQQSRLIEHPILNFFFCDIHRPISRFLDQHIWLGQIVIPSTPQSSPRSATPHGPYHRPPGSHWFLSVPLFAIFSVLSSGIWILFTFWHPSNFIITLEWKTSKSHHRPLFSTRPIRARPLHQESMLRRKDGQSAVTLKSQNKPRVVTVWSWNKH